MGTKLASSVGMKHFSYLLVAGCIWGCPTPPPVQTETAIQISANVSVEGFSQQIMVSNAFFFFAEMRLVSGAFVGPETADHLP